MARLSGLASDHHVKGPGDSNRRRGRKPKNGSVDASQGTKRSASPIVEVATTVKRTKRVTTDDHEQIEQELEASMARSQASDTIQVETTRRRRRHSDPLGAAQDEDEDDNEEAATPPPASQPIHGLTPHLERLGAPRGKPQRRAASRQSMPAQLPHVLPGIDETNGDGTKVQFEPLVATLSSRKKRQLRRNHLSEEVNDIEQHKKDDMKLRQAFTKLHEQLKEKEAQIEELEYNLEAQRMGNIDMTADRTAELQQELKDARQALHDLRTSSAYTPDDREISEDDDDDNEPLMLIDPDDLNVSQEQMRASPHPNGYHATRALATSQTTTESIMNMTQTTEDILAVASQAHSDIIPDRISDQAVTRYETEIDRLTHQLADAQGSLRVLSIEVMNLHILDVGASLPETLLKWRHALEDAREAYEKLFGPITGMNNADFIARLVEDLQGQNGELLQKTVLVEKQNQAIQLLRTQYESTMGCLADSERRVEELSAEHQTLGEKNSENETEITTLNDRVVALREIADTQKKDLDDKNVQLNALKMELEDKDTSLDRQRQAIEAYQRDLLTAETAVVALETEHAAVLGQLRTQHEEQVNDLEAQLESERADRVTFEEDLQQKNSLIESLEERIDNMEAEADAITVRVDDLRERNAKEIQLRETAEEERDDHAETIRENKEKIAELDLQIEDLNETIAEFRGKLTSERTQREQAEMDLDQANEQIEDLTRRIHDEGIQANELRSKLFQAQQEKAQATADLKQAAEDARVEHEEELTIETSRREEAEQDVARLEKEVSGLQKSLTATEDALSEMTSLREAAEKERDERTAQLARQLEELQNLYNALENSSQSTITTLNSTILDLNNTVTSLQSQVEGLETAAVEEAEKHNGEIASLDSEVNDLKTELGDSREKNVRQEKKIVSLERRLESISTEVLNIQDHHNRETTDLKTTIKSQQAHIEDLQRAAAENAATHEQEIIEKRKEVEEHTMIGAARAEYIVELEAQIEEIKDRFRQQAEDSDRTIDGMIETNRQTIARQEEDAAAVKKRTADALKAVNEMKVKGLQVKTNGVDLRKVAHGKVTKVNEKVKITKKSRGGAIRKRMGLRDSGFVESFEDEQLETDEGVVG
jgi:myosin protein heavy chain